MSPSGAAAGPTKRRGTSFSARFRTGRRFAKSFSTPSPPSSGWRNRARTCRGRRRAFAERLREACGRRTPSRSAVERQAARQGSRLHATTILTLAICLGANAAIFTVVYSVLLRPLPVPDADRIVAMGDVYPTITPNDILSNTRPPISIGSRRSPTLEEQAMFALLVRHA